MLLDFLPLVRGRERTLPIFKSFVKGILQVSSLRGVTLTSTDYSERTAHSVDLPSYNHDKFAALLKFVEGVHGEIEIARLQASHHFREVLPEHRHIEHVLICPKGKKQSAARICGQRA